LRVRILVGEGEGTAVERPEVAAAFNNGVLSLAGRGIEGVIDEASGTARADLPTPGAVERADYFLRAGFALLAYQEGGFLLHAAGVVRGGGALLFMGPSGSGKTTVTRFAREEQVLSDDLLLVLPGTKGWDACATPFWSVDQVPPRGDARAPVRALFRLRQDREVHLGPLGPGAALAELMAHIPVITLDPGRGEGLLRRGAKFLETIPAYDLHFQRDPSFWGVVEGATLA
jgi:hypothetical protein